LQVFRLSESPRTLRLSVIFPPLSLVPAVHNLTNQLFHFSAVP